MNENKHIVILTTGGTIEKSYSEFEGALTNRESQLKARLLSLLRLPKTSIEVNEVMAKDSLDMTEEDRHLILEQIKEHSAKKSPIIILHGTDTLEQTAKLVFEAGPWDIPIIFTGAMVPAGFIDTDANQNFTESLIAAQILPSGVYVVFHNQIFQVPNVQKNKPMATFETKDGQGDYRSRVEN